jgi:hypothetical protein
MPCAKLSITNDIIRKIKKKTNGICSETSAHIIVIPVMSFSSRFPFRPKGERIANITIYWKKLKKINIKKFHSIINKFNNYIKNEYICYNSKHKLILELMNEVELFIDYIEIIMKWENIDEETCQIYFNKEASWKTF